MRNLGYEFQYGIRTTPGHAKAWMEANKKLVREKLWPPKEEDERRSAKLAALK
jgi:hypothetical protein